jgi:ubiquinone/menaquinone biosynthesis C-methylase UbiE
MNLELDRQKKEDMDLHDKKIAHKYETIREICKFSKHYQEQWIEEMLNSIPNTPKKILDYCCGTSILFPFVKNKFGHAKYYGIDISKKMLNVGKKRFGSNKNFKISQHDGEDLPFLDFFDAAISRGAIHHLPNPSKGLKNIHDSLHKGGFLVISEPTSNFVVKAFRKILYRLLSHFSSSHKSFTLPELKKLLISNGFKVIKVRHFGLFAFPFGFPDIIPVFRYVPYLLLRFLEKIDRILLKIPVIRSFSWSVILVVQKK